MAETAFRGSTATSGAIDPTKKLALKKTPVSFDDFHEKMMSFGPEGPPPGFDPDAFEVDEASIGPRKTLRGTGFPAEDAPFDDYDDPDYDMMPEPYEPEGMDYRKDSMSGEMVLMPDERKGSGFMRSGTGALLDSSMRAMDPSLLDPTKYGASGVKTDTMKGPGSGVSGKRLPSWSAPKSFTSGIDGITRTPEDLEALRSDDMKAKLAKERAIPPGGSAAWMDAVGRRWKDGEVIYDPEWGTPDPTRESALASGAVGHGLTY